MNEVKIIIIKIFLIIITIFSLNTYSMVVIDVRTQEEFNDSHIQESLHIEWQGILSIEDKTIPKDEAIYLYCRSGNRSGKAAKILIESGYTNITNAGSITDASKLLKLKIIKIN